MPPDSLTVIFIQLFQVNCCHLFFEQLILPLTDTYTLNLYLSNLIHRYMWREKNDIASSVHIKHSNEAAVVFYNSFMLLMIFWDIMAAVGEEQSPPIVSLVIVWFFSLSHYL